VARIICEFVHFQGEVNGIQFVQDRGQWISPDLTDEVAGYLASVPGYRLVAQPAPKPKAKGPAEPATADQAAGK
jgi:hypothetical protein